MKGSSPLSFGASRVLVVAPLSDVRHPVAQSSLHGIPKTCTKLPVEDVLTGPNFRRASVKSAVPKELLNYVSPFLPQLLSPPIVFRAGRRRAS